MATTTSHPAAQRLVDEICDAIVQVLHDHTGRGPAQALAYVDEDLVTVLLLGTMTPADEGLATCGEARFMLDLRHKLQLTIADDCIAHVERLTGRTVAALMSNSHLDPDVALAAFVLSPVAASAAPPASARSRTR
jgi:uncharacterized protein YbcI